MRELTISQALNEALREEMTRDQRVFVLGEDVAQYGGTFDVTKNLLEQFGPDRIVGTPISEGAIVGACVGSALGGMRPVGEIMFVDFLLCAMDQMVNYAATLPYAFGGNSRLPLTIRTTYGTHGGAQHSKSLEALLAHVPGIKLTMPVTPYDAKGLLKSAIRDENPVVQFENRHLYHSQVGGVPEGEYLVPIGKADIKRPGKDVTVVAIGRPVHYSLEAAKSLAQEGIDAEIIDPRTLVPIDMETILASVHKTRRVVVVHDSWRSFGFGAEIAARIYESAFRELDAPIARVTQEDFPTPYSITLGKEIKPDAEKIAEAVRRLVEGETPR